MSTLPTDADTLDGLSVAERIVLERLRHPQRRREFLAARRLTKALARRHGFVPETVRDCDLSVLPAPGEASRRPRLMVHLTVDDSTTDSASGSHALSGQIVPVDVSISHAGQRVAVALARGSRVGVDLVAPKDVRDDRLAPWLTHAERNVAVVESLRLSELWAMKEAAFKATSTDQPFRPGDFPVTADLGWQCGGCRVVIQPLGRLTLAVATPDRTLLHDPPRLFLETAPA